MILLEKRKNLIIVFFTSFFQVNLEEIYDYLSFRLKRSDFLNFPVSNYRLKEVSYIW